MKLNLLTSLNITFFIILVSRALLYGCSAESKITPIVHSPGIYFEPVTSINFYNDYWKVVTHIELISLHPYLDNIETLLQKSEKLCNKIQLSDLIQCKEAFSPIDVLVQSNLIKLQSLSHITLSKSQSKVKRSLEFGGEILKFFFGTLDADDARKYDSAIESCKKSENELFHLMKDNIHVVKSTINNFNSTIYKLSQNEIKINSQIDNMNGILSQITKIDNELFYISRINSLLNIIESSVLSVSNLLDTTLNAILFSKVNVLHPSVISPLNLFNELSMHSNQLDKRLDFPLPLNVNNIHSIIDASKLSSYYYNNKIVFVLQVPLITSETFMVYKNIPLPTPHDESRVTRTFALIQPSDNYIGLSDNRIHYAMFNNLDKCKFISGNYSICELVSIFSSLGNPNCESKLLTEVTLSLPSQCFSKLLIGQIDIWQKLSNNRWIYVQSDPSKLTIKCHDDIVDYSIIGTGIVKLTEECIGFSRTIQLMPSNSYTNIIKSPLDITFDITQDDCCKKEVFNKTLPHLTPINLSKINLESLKYASHHLDNLENEINKLQSESHFIRYAQYYSTFTYVLIILMFLFIGYKLYKCYRYRNIKPDSGCCIQIFNQCHNKKMVKHNSNITNSIEMTDVSSSEDEKRSIKSLPAPHTSFKLEYKHPSRRNLNF